MEVQFELGASALNALEQRLDVTAANMASQTPGSKKTIAAIENASVDSPNFNGFMNAPEIQVARDFSQGPISHTGNPTDVAIRGDKGFFSLDGGSVFTRDGQFVWGPDGKLSNALGMPVDGESGPIVRDPALGLVSIDGQGNVFQGNQRVNKLKVVDVEDPNQLVARPGGFGLGENQGPPVAMTEVSVAPRSLEGSNGHAADYMREYVELQRAHEAVTRFVSQADAMYANAARYLMDS